MQKGGERVENLELLKVLNEEIGLLKERIEELKKENDALRASLDKQIMELLQTLLLRQLLLQKK